MCYILIVLVVIVMLFVCFNGEKIVCYLIDLFVMGEWLVNWFGMIELKDVLLFDYVNVGEVSWQIVDGVVWLNIKELWVDNLQCVFIQMLVWMIFDILGVIVIGELWLLVELLCCMLEVCVEIVLVEVNGIYCLLGCYFVGDFGVGGFNQVCSFNIVVLMGMIELMFVIVVCVQLQVIVQFVWQIVVLGGLGNLVCILFSVLCMDDIFLQLLLFLDGQFWIRFWMV